jgi:hypothetical protein
MEISTGACGAFELDPVCAVISASSSGAPTRWRAFTVQLAAPLIACNSGLGQSFRQTSEYKLSLLHGVC